nr:hypothetical protein [Tanacetum cinerariifolium]
MKFLAVACLDLRIRLEERATWVWGQGNMGWSGEGFGTVQVRWDARECRVRKKGNLARNMVRDVPVLPAGDTEALEADEPTPIPRSAHISIPLSQTRLRKTRKTVRPEPSMSASDALD